MLRQIVCVLIALQFVALSQPRNVRFKLELYNLTCRIITDRMKRFDCYLKKTSENNFRINQYLMFSRNLGKDFQARLWVEVLPQNGKNVLNFLDVRLKVCESLTQPFQRQLLTIILNEMRRTSNIPRSCPFKGNFLYKFTNISVTDSFFPAYSPFLNFSYTFEFYDNKGLFAASTLMGAIMPFRK